MFTTIAFLLLINSARAHHPLVESKTLDKVAAVRVAYLCKHPFSHDGWQAAFDNTPFSWIGENLAQGFPTVKATEAALMASPAHKANILDPHYHYLGVAHACGITVQEFGGFAQ